MSSRNRIRKTQIASRLARGNPRPFGTPAPPARGTPSPFTEPPGPGIARLLAQSAKKARS
jgi:hypothetical protein